MHSAPSVSYPVGRSRAGAVLLLALWLTAVAVVALWWLAAGPDGWKAALAVLLLASAGLSAAWSGWRAPAGTLAWDGEGWSWTGQGTTETGVPLACLDLQRWLLLRWTAERCSRWLWLERARSRPHWDDLRRAVYSRARPPARPGAQPPAART